MQGREGREGEGRGGEGRSTCLPPRFDNPGYGPVRGEKGRGRKGWRERGEGEREGGRRKGREGERDLAPQKKNPGTATGNVATSGNLGSESRKFLPATL